ncbi:CGL52 [Auxenochlorella protothecoides x Auxenochlorella symbiontica]
MSIQTTHFAACRPCTRPGICPCSLIPHEPLHAGPARRSRVGSSPLRAVKRRVEILDEQAIDNLAACCDDFVCTSSPAVENSVRTLARDIQRADGSWTRRILAPDVVYKDNFRSFKGIQGYDSLDFVPNVVSPSRVTIRRMRMLRQDLAVVEWVLDGRLGPLSLSVQGETEAQLNLLSGRIVEQRESWPGAPLPWTLARALWSVGKKTKDTVRGGKAAIDSALDQEGESQNQFQGDPTDPTRFFMDQTKNSLWNDMINLSLFGAIIYLFTQTLYHLWK